MQVTTSEWAAQIARKMASMGFEPSRKHSPTLVEYHKQYIDKLGRRASAVVSFRKDPAGRVEAQLHAFVVTVQAVIQPERQVVETQTPGICRADLLSILDELGSSSKPSVSVVEKECQSCGTQTEEFYVVDKRHLCRNCYNGQAL